MTYRLDGTGFLLGALFVLMTSAHVQAADIKTAVFAGGCFWCMEPPYDKAEGLIETISGYSNGNIPDPTYDQVSRGGTGHVEVVQVTFDSEIIGYEELLEIYWPNIDPLDGDGQFCDQGESYRPGIFYSDDAQREAAEASKQLVADVYGLDSGMVSIEPLTSFYPAEDYHQDYYMKNSYRYTYYRWGCGRDARLDEVWGGIERVSLFD